MDRDDVASIAREVRAEFFGQQPEPPAADSEPPAPAEPPSRLQQAEALAAAKTEKRRLVDLGRTMLEDEAGYEISPSWTDEEILEASGLLEHSPDFVPADPPYRPAERTKFEHDVAHLQSDWYKLAHHQREARAADIGLSQADFAELDQEMRSSTDPNIFRR